MKLYDRKIRLTKEGAGQEGWIKKADEVSGIIDAILISADYSKYENTYFLLKLGINIFKIDNKTDVILLNSYKDKLQQIANATKEGNKNLYKVAEELIDEYEEAIQWRLEQQEQE